VTASTVQQASRPTSSSTGKHAPKQGSLSCTWGLRTPASLSVRTRNQPRSLLPPPCSGPLGSPSWSKEQSRSTPRRYASNSRAHQSSGALIQRVERLPLLDDEPVQGPIVHVGDQGHLWFQTFRALQAAWDGCRDAGTRTAVQRQRGRPRAFGTAVRRRVLALLRL